MYTSELILSLVVYIVEVYNKGKEPKLLVD
jgi:hypothetical protein